MDRTNLPIRIREAHEEDVPFIFNAWLKCFREAPFAKNITSTIYFAEHHKLLEELLKKQKCFIACNDTDPNQIYGFICADHVDSIFCLHFLYVKHHFRKLGIAKQLLNAFEHDPAVASIYTHTNKVSDRYAAKYNMVYHPYTAFNIAYSKEESDA